MFVDQLLGRLGMGKRTSRRRAVRVQPSGMVLEARCLLAATANLIAYRPVTPHIDFTKHTISEADESNSQRGAGIRVNGDDDNGNGQRDFLDKAPLATVDNDLVRVDVAGSGTSLVVSWTGSLAVWTSATKAAAVLNGGTVATGMSLWVEYTSEVHTVSSSTALQLWAGDGVTSATDTVVFHSFQSVVIAFGGNTQNPAKNGDPSLGTFTMATTLYGQGYDVQLYAHDQVKSNGTGAAYNEVVSAVLKRNVNSVGIYGYSWGGGGTYNLAVGLSKNKQLAPAGYRLAYTGYVDGIRRASIGAETRKPTGTAYHDNFYQRKDFLLKGNSVKGANNVNVTTTGWGALLRHTTIDDNPTLQSLLIGNLTARLIA